VPGRPSGRFGPSRHHEHRLPMHGLLSCRPPESVRTNADSSDGGDHLAVIDRIDQHDLRASRRGFRARLRDARRRMHPASRAGASTAARQSRAAPRKISRIWSWFSRRCAVTRIAGDRLSIGSFAPPGRGKDHRVAAVSRNASIRPYFRSRRRRPPRRSLRAGVPDGQEGRRENVRSQASPLRRDACHLFGHTAASDWLVRNRPRTWATESVDRKPRAPRAVARRRITVNQDDSGRARASTGSSRSARAS